MEISIAEAAKLAEVTTQQIRALVRTGKIKGRKAHNVGKPGPATWKIDQTSLEAYIRSRLQ